MISNSIWYDIFTIEILFTGATLRDGQGGRETTLCIEENDFFDNKMVVFGLQTILTRSLAKVLYKI